jgi:hypothetical protein
MSESMINTQSVLKAGGASAKIEEMLTLAKGQKAKALEHIIDQILSNPLIFVFGEFLSQPNFIEVTPLIINAANTTANSTAAAVIIRAER